MLIDIHTHAFPEKISKMTLEKLKEGIRSIQGDKYIPHPCTDGTVAGLKENMAKAGVDLSFVMPIATKVKHFESINAFAAEITDGSVISFGSVHPMQENAADAIKILKENGFKGIKLHHQFQLCDVDSRESIALIKACEDNEMYVMMHAGSDIGLPPPLHCTPKKLKNALEYVSGKYLIAAHLGGWDMWEDVYRLLAGTNIKMDTAFISEFIDKELCKKIIKKHGSDKIYFGSDCPWEDPADTLSFIDSLGLTEEEKENILYRNAKRDFGI